MILVIGGRSKIGAALIGELLGRGQRVRALVRAGEPVGRVPVGAEEVTGDLADEGSLVTAMAGIEKVFLLSSPHPDATRWHRHAIDAARRTEVQLLVRSSILGADRESRAEFISAHTTCDRYLEDAGLPHVIVRPNLFLQNIRVGHRAASWPARGGRVPRQPRRRRPGASGLLVRMNGQPRTAADRAPVTGPVALVLSRQVRPGHEQAFEEILHRLASAVRSQPGHLDVTVLQPAPGGPPIYTIVSHFRTRADAEAWQASPQRARLVAEAGLHADGELQTRYVSGLEGWLAAPGAPVLVPPGQWKIALVSAAGILPLLELVSYLLAPRLAALPVWARPLISVVIVIPLMQYAVMPLLTRVTRGFLYPAPAPRPAAGAA